MLAFTCWWKNWISVRAITTEYIGGAKFRKNSAFKFPASLTEGMGMVYCATQRKIIEMRPRAWARSAHAAHLGMRSMTLR